MKSKLKATGIQRLKLKYDNLPSSFAFNFNWRRYMMGFLIATRDIDPYLNKAGGSLGTVKHCTRLTLNLLLLLLRAYV